MLGTLALLLAAVNFNSTLASTFVQSESDTGWVSTDLGTVRKTSLRRLCLSKRVYIADVTGVQSRTQTLDSGAEIVVSDLQMTIVVPLRGTFPSNIYIENVMGGDAGGKSARAPSSSLQPQVGKRYVVGQTEYEHAPGDIRWMVLAALEVDPESELPENIAQQFMSNVSEHCPESTQ